MLLLNPKVQSLFGTKPVKASNFTDCTDLQSKTLDKLLLWGIKV